MTEPPNEWRMMFYVGLAAAAGSIVALYSMQWKSMSWKDISFTLLSGFLVAVFAVPYIAEHWLGMSMVNVKEVTGVTFIGGTLWNSLMPLALRKVKEMLGLKEEVTQ